MSNEQNKVADPLRNMNDMLLRLKDIGFGLEKVGLQMHINFKVMEKQIEISFPYATRELNSKKGYFMWFYEDDLKWEVQMQELSELCDRLKDGKRMIDLFVPQIMKKEREKEMTNSMEVNSALFGEQVSSVADNGARTSSDIHVEDLFHDIEKRVKKTIKDHLKPYALLVWQTQWEVLLRDLKRFGIELVPGKPVTLNMWGYELLVINVGNSGEGMPKVVCEKRIES